jgi:multidrug efflux system membrane fusion protein
MTWTVALTRLALLEVLVVEGACSATPAPATTPPPTSVTTATVEMRNVELWDEFAGRIAAVDAIDVRARVSGYVTAMRYREGADVAAGDLLFTIDPRPYQATLARATAELARARARASLAHDQADRAERLNASAAIPRSERDTTVSAAVQADAEVQAALAAVELAHLDVEFTQVRSPLAGRAGQARVKRGDYIAAGPLPTLLTSVVSVDPSYVYFTSDEQTYLRYGTRAGASRVFVGLSDESGFPHEAKIDFIDNRLDPATGTIRVRAVLPNPDHRFIPGLFARVKVSAGTAEQAMLIDDKAILTDQDRKYVYVVGPGDVVARRDVKLGRVVDGIRVITDGLKVGDRVIVRGIQKVFPGSRIAVDGPGGPAAGART